jgi:hypothetical protein
MNLNFFLLSENVLTFCTIILVIGPGILVYTLIKTNKCIKMTTLMWCLVKRSYMFRRANAIIKELIWSSQDTYMLVCTAQDYACNAHQHLRILWESYELHDDGVSKPKHVGAFD